MHLGYMRDLSRMFRNYGDSNHYNRGSTTDVYINDNLYIRHNRHFVHNIYDDAHC